MSFVGRICLYFIMLSNVLYNAKLSITRVKRMLANTLFLSPLREDAN